MVPSRTRRPGLPKISAQVALWIDALPEPTLLIEPKRRIVVRANAAFGQRVGQPREAMVGTDWFATCTDPAESKSLADLLGRALDTGRAADCEVHHNGVYATHRLIPLGGASTAARLVVHTISDQARSRQSIRDAEAREAILLAAQRIAHVGHYTVDLQTGAITWSDELYRIHGRDPATFVPTPETSLEGVHPEDRQTLMDAITHALASTHQPEEDGRATLFRLEHRSLRPDGSVRWLHLEARADLDAAGRPLFMVGTVHDQTDAQLSTERLRLVLAATHDGIWDWNLISNQAFLSSRCKEIVGYRDDEIANNEDALLALLHPDDRASAIASFRRHIAQPAPFRVELRLRHKDGSDRWVLARGEVVCDSAARPVRMVGAITDITAQRQAEERERASQEELRRVVSSVSDYLWSAEGDASGQIRYRYHSIGCKRITGYEPAYFSEPKRWLDLVHPDDRGRLFESFTRLTGGQSTTEEQEYRLRRADGTEVWVRDRGHAERQPDGRVEYRGVVSDISERKRQEEVQARLALVFDAATDHQLLFSVGPDGRLVVEAANRAYRELLRRLVPNWNGRLVGHERTQLMRSMGIDPADDVNTAEAMRLATATGTAHRYQQVYRFAGNRVVLDVSLWPVRGDEGRTTALLWSARDVTERVTAEESLRASLDAKETLLREVHHRVKNNLQIICSLLGLQADAVKDRGMRHVLIEAENRVRTIAVVHEHLYQSSDLSVIALGDYIRALARWMAQMDGGRCAVEVVCDEGVTVGIDAAVPVGLMLHELLTNALRHGARERPGVVRLTLQRHDDRIRLQVRDQGLGVAPDWESRLDRSLGLRLVRALSQQLRGRFELITDSGTVATIDFPVPKHALDATRAPAQGGHE